MIKPDLDFIRQRAVDLEDENFSFRLWLEKCNSNEVDSHVSELNKRIAPQIDCTQCGNCCRSFMINVEPDEIAPVAKKLGVTEEEVKTKYVESGNEGMMVINKIPCHFLSENKCTIYEQRFLGCREFPHLDKPGFRDRIFSMFMFYGICPIVYHVIEDLKGSLEFRNK